MGVSFALALLFSIQTQAAEHKLTGMFRPAQLAKNLEKSLGKKSPADCRVDPTLSKHSFSAEITCAYQCTNQKTLSKNTISNNFDPMEEGMRQGDGYDDHTPVMASFTAIFMNWASKNCLNFASEKCGSIDKVEVSDFTNIASGTWKLTEKPSCEQNKSNIISPYDSDFKLTKAAPKTIQKSVLSHYFAFETQDKKAKCKNPIQGKVCFGDCFLYDDQNPNAHAPLTLMTKESPVFDQEETVCADPLVKELSLKPLSKSVVETICQNFYTQSLSQSKVIGSSCAAFRGSANCKDLINKFSKK